MESEFIETADQNRFNEEVRDLFRNLFAKRVSLVCYKEAEIDMSTSTLSESEVNSLNLCFGKFLQSYNYVTSIWAESMEDLQPNLPGQE